MEGRRQVKKVTVDKQSDSRCWAKQNKKDWGGDKSTTIRATGSVEQNKARFKIETETNVNNEQSDSKQAVLATEGGNN